MLFSVIVPVYNVEKYLKECIDSIINQMLQMPSECELLLIDDGSKDSSGSICDLYYGKYPNIIKVFHNNNQGLLLTRRYGFMRASGDYIVNCDSDDKLEDGALQKLKTVIISYNEPDVILFNHILYDGKKNQIAFENIFTNGNVCVIDKNTVLKEFLVRHSVVSMWGKICKHTCIDKNKDYSKFEIIGNGEDTFQSIEFYNNAKTFVYINEALYNYRTGTGMTQKYDPNYFFVFKAIIEHVEDQRELWKLDEFNKLVGVKVLATLGRAVTQSRYKKWKNYADHKIYLREIREDELFIRYIDKLYNVRDLLQKDHFFLLLLLKFKCYGLITLLLKIKNIISYKK